MGAPFLFVDEVDVGGWRCLLGLDLDVPLFNGEVTDDTGITRSSWPEVSLRKGAKIIILTHLGQLKS